MNNIQDAIMKISSNKYDRNRRILIKEFGSLEYRDNDGNSLYHLLIASHASFAYKSYGFETLFHFNIDTNGRNKDGDTFVHYALKQNADMHDITFSLSVAMMNGFNIDAKNNCGYTVLHDAIIYIRNQEALLRFVYALSNVGFDFNAKDPNGDDIITFINNQEQLSELAKTNLRRMITTNGKDYHKINVQAKEEINKPMKLKVKYGSILNDKEYDREPALGREKELQKLIVSLATDKKLPLLIGPSGVGKTSIADSLAYHIVKGDVPNFLKDKLIYETHMSTLISGTRFRGDFEAKMEELVRFAQNNNAILFIDEFHMVFGAGAAEGDKTDASSIIKHYIDRYGLKVFGATTNTEYQEYMVHDALKRRFEVIKVNELDNSKLREIVYKELYYSAENKQIYISDMIKDNIDDIINILLDLTKDGNRNINDKIYNPDLILSLIDRAFAYAEVDNQHLLELKHLILGIDDNERIKDTAKNNAIYNLNSLNTNDISYVKTKVIDFSEYKKEHVI